MARIYTKGGDKGQTSLFGGPRISKSDLRLEAYGGLDELNSILGVARTLMTPYPEFDHSFVKIQNYLFTLGSHLALGDPKLASHLPKLNPDRTLELEKQIDSMEENLPKLTNFILPGGSPLAAQLHLGRTVCRRAERAVVRLEDGVDPEIVIYLNRLSDFLFVGARYANKLANVSDVLWEKN